jgi:hypothetical protein
VTIWSEGLKALGYTPDGTWVGQWLVINGMIDPLYHGKNRFKTVHYISVGPTVTDRSQVHKVSQEEALWRLGKGPRTGTVGGGSSKQGKPVPDKNAAILSQLGGATKPVTRQWPVASSPTKAGTTSKPTAPPGSSVPGPPTGQSAVKTRNEQILQNMGAGSQTPPSSSGMAGQPGQQEPKGCAKWAAMIFGSFLLIVVYLVSKIM